jgi:uncharacterized protein YkwD
VPAELELALWERANADRAAHGLPPLAFDYDLLEIARARAHAQIELPRLSHTGAAGEIILLQLLTDRGAPYYLAGENLARLVGPETTAAARAEEALMNSPGHRANILDTAFDRLAVGVARDGQGRIIFAQVFRATSPGR